eukprot:gnl/TRDRNA2_/TRDRNA2_186118_c0_seq1.p1 gnl/TRDRNA2_/TRDRNA2_186118_c0~~gnl/TRDRNA2_/TRDRNA2_186118_c0_seq1.p1  ORF type:complete len:496 (+),score=124.37 gnl/TRDRNA2_/TRDRNA2_186118_c0_seq1:98-1585(+)
MSIDDDEYYKEELERRDAQIQRLRDNLQGWRDRVEDADYRTEELNDSKRQLEAQVEHVQLCTLKLEQKGDAIESFNSRQREAIAGGGTAAAAEKEGLAKAIAAASEVWRLKISKAEEERQRSKTLRVEAGSVRAIVESLRREAERNREDLARDTADEEARKVRLHAAREKEGQQRTDTARADLAAASREARSAREQVSALQSELATERECSEGLKTALGHTEERHQQAVQEIATLERQLSSLEASLRQRDLADAEASRERQVRDELDKSDSQCIQLEEAVAAAKRDAQLQRQRLQGALNETKRMVTTQLSSDRGKSEPMLTTLRRLKDEHEDARAKADDNLASATRIAQECDAIEEEQRRALDAEAAAKASAERAQVLELGQAVAAARLKLEATLRLSADAREAVIAAEVSVSSTRAQYEEKEAALKRKRQDLWDWLRAQAEGLNRADSSQLGSAPAMMPPDSLAPTWAKLPPAPTTTAGGYPNSVGTAQPYSFR